MTKEEVDLEIRAAFAGTKLDGGVGIRRAVVRDNYGRGTTANEFAALGRLDEQDRWTTLTAEFLGDYDIIAYLDAKGFRFYMSAYILAALNSPDWPYDSSPAVVFPLDPRGDQDAREYALRQFELLTNAQRTAIAHFLQFLMESFAPQSASAEHPRWLDGEHVTVERAIRTYWHNYL